ncbi:MAG: hypothetical protein Q9227_002430 [Pyrenula ochraceoflavens]
MAGMEVALLMSTFSRPSRTVWMQHKLWDISLEQRLFLAPASPKDVLDLGCGTGRWAIEIAKSYPEASVTGSDLSPIQTSTIPNCKIVTADFSEDWTSVKSWEHLISESDKYLRPGGWIELQEFHLPLQSDDDSIPPDSAIACWGQIFIKALKKMGTDVDSTVTIPPTLQDKGFVNVQHVHRQWLYGPWVQDEEGKEISQLFTPNLLEGVFPASVRVMQKALGMSQSETDVLLDALRQEVSDATM